jgi:hypothetical protein
MQNGRRTIGCEKSGQTAKASVGEDIIVSMTRAGIDPGAYQLAYDEAKRALDEQERAVFELRSRAGQLIAGAAIATSFFGG